MNDQNIILPLDVAQELDEEALAKLAAADVAERERLDFPGAATLEPEMVEALKTDSITLGRTARGAPLEPSPVGMGFIRLDDKPIEEVPDGYCEIWTNHPYRSVGILRSRVMRAGNLWMRLVVQHKHRQPNEAEVFMAKDLFIGHHRTAIEVRLAARDRLPPPPNTRVLFAQLDGSDAIPDLRNPKDGWL